MAAGDAAVNSFEDVRGLSEPELRTLVEQGRPEQRVWAIWALALRSSDAAVGELAQRTEPAPGVRRNLAVVLAGHGHYDLLVALAKRDPAPEVRAAGVQLITRIAIDGKLPPALVIERIGAEGPEVKIAVLGTIFAGAPPWLAELAQQLLDDADADVRYESFEALVRAGRDPAALMWLEEAPEAEVRLALMKWTARGRVHPAAQALSGASRRLRRLLIECVRVANWHDLAPAVGSEPTLIRAIAGRLPQVLEQIPLAILVRAAIQEPSDAWIHTIGNRLAALSSPDPELGDLLSDLCELCQDRIEDIDRDSAQIERDKQLDSYAEIALEELAGARALHERTLENALRLVVH